MKLCPICGVELRLRVAYDVEVGSCLRCGGMWLDGGELRKLIAKIREYRWEHYSGDRYREWEEEWREKKKKVFSIFLTRYLTETPHSSTAEDAVDAASSPARRSR